MYSIARKRNPVQENTSAASDEVVFDAGEMSIENGCQHIVEGISIISSPLCPAQNGVYIEPKSPIPPGTALSVYPGLYKIMPVNFDFSDSKYSYCVTIRNQHPQAHKQYVLDAVNESNSIKYGIGHLINSSHPNLPYPYNKPNCFLEEERPTDYDCSVRPPIVFVVSLLDISVPCELLIDYHWRLNGLVSPLTDKLLTCTCRQCSDV